MIFFPSCFHKLDEPQVVTITTVLITTEISDPFLHQHTYQHVHDTNIKHSQHKKKVSLVPRDVSSLSGHIDGYQLLLYNSEIFSAYNTSIYKSILFALQIVCLYFFTEQYFWEIVPLQNT